MKKRMMVGSLVVAAHIPGIPGALAGPWEDGMAAYNRGDHVPAIRLFREVSRSMTREEISQAREMAQACEASNYRVCEY